jgi:hypothetical protein
MDDETAEIVEGRVRIASVRCNNGCSPENEAEEEEEEEKPKRKKRTPATVVRGEMCPVDECTRPAHHRGRHNHAGREAEA